MRYAVRSLLKAPAFSFLVILTLSLGIGATTAIFTVFRGVLMRPLPHQDGDAIVYLQQSAARAGLDDVKFSVPEIIDLRQGATSLTGFAEFSSMPFTMIGLERPIQVQAGIVTADYFDVMGLQPVVGRGFGPGDAGEAASPVMVLGFEYWQRAFGADPAVIGRVVRMNGLSVEIVGVLEPAPPFPMGTDVFVNVVTSPHHLDATMVHGRSHRMTDVFARLAPGAALATAQAEVDGIAARVYGDYPQNYDPAAGYEISITPLRDALVNDARLTLYLLMAAAGLVLLTTCANAANLVLTRSIRREREFAVRWAMGADRASLRRILLAETGVLAAVGALGGLLLAVFGMDLLVGFAARFTARASEITIDWGVLLFAVVAASAAAVAFAWAPGLRSQELQAATLTRSGSRTTGGGRGLQKGLIVAQVAASVTMLTAAGLLGHTLLTLDAVDPGVIVENTLTLEAPIDFSAGAPAEVLAMQEEMARRIGELPGVDDVGVGLSVPLRPGPVSLEIRVDGIEVPEGEPVPLAEFRTATPRFFDAAGMRILRGRNFEATDVADGAPVAILNQALAERLFGTDDPIGRRVTWTGEVLSAIGMRENWRTIVGVVSDSRDNGPDRPPPQVLFEPLAQNSMGWFPGAFVIRGTEAAERSGQVQQIINQLAPEVPVLRMQTLEQIRQDAIGAQRLNTVLVGVLGGLVLVISAVGLAGVLGFFISERTGEIGIRMSLGAAPGRVLTMVIADGARLLGLGIVLGLAGSLAVSRFLEGFLFGVEPGDPRTLITVVLVMSAVGLGAAAIPAMRAARIDPLVAIRKE